ncbi:MAG: thiol:disulfide interchange protein [Candidatus Dactylopiibacterium carminicum]|uniref:Thiol:disulfide interchange protein DsbD n=1 Tax=Candidatus Dactylopiibacterium carminicum TaxID=857335 RepID=A0A272EYK2_9RHOO|nr:protein-disulfide reductase DsbD [Candidatus Dactylopiibacterium carminicum]KAF7600575.1 protein-disulfide reductase DsbD [Candidatus Dactylopiibacterium carminicum]PAS94214.1 MAG: thiol:disulfide interchange protein [Candidatus Dactylopiibacterium carminicum]PAS95189.1 MAG: thiol:disulfide interchange protein [Candidatus Dactylopiibacterium carminicum]PAT00580.1 MAG: thiol:disulfide interchange protein [Candidatus Dactylopiibacterium carminicum]
MSRLLALCLLCWSLIASANPEPLPPDQAFRASAVQPDTTSVELSFRIEPGYYLYREKFRFQLDGQPTTAELPEGLAHEDAFFGRQQIYRDSLRIRIPVDRQLPAEAALTVRFQGCADIGICYPPTDITLHPARPQPVADLGQRSTPGWLQGVGNAPAATPLPQSTPTSTANEAPSSDTEDGIAGLLAGGHLLLILPAFFGLGLLLSFTPCTLPMLPILSGIIVGHGHGISRGRAFALSTAYVLGMALTYAAAGVLAAYSGQLLSAWLQNVWVLGALALMFVALALAMFGIFDLQLPSRWQHRLSTSAHHHGDSVGQLAIMGAISALIVGPCITAPLAGALLYIARTGDALLGGLALFSLALGMGLPLVIVGVAARHWLPKPGRWMEGVKRFFGFLLLATALYLVSPVLPPLLPMLGWGALLLTGGVFLRAIDPLPPDAPPLLRLLKGIGLILLLAGAAMLAGALAGGRDPLQPLAAFGADETAAQHAKPRFERVRSNAELDARLAASPRPVMLDFYADWCVSCKEMEYRTFSDPRVAERMGGFTLLQADVTQNTPEDRALLKRFGLFGPPGILFFDAGGQEQPALRAIGFLPPERFLNLLSRAVPGGPTP